MSETFLLFLIPAQHNFIVLSPMHTYVCVTHRFFFFHWKSNFKRYAHTYTFAGDEATHTYTFADRRSALGGMVWSGDPSLWYLW